MDEADLTQFRQTIALIQQARVRFVVIGGLALVLYGSDVTAQVLPESAY